MATKPNAGRPNFGQDIATMLQAMLSLPQQEQTHLALADALEEAGHAELAKTVRQPPLILVVNWVEESDGWHDPTLIMVRPEMYSLVLSVQMGFYGASEFYSEEGDILGSMLVDRQKTMRVPCVLGDQLDPAQVPLFARYVFFTVSI